MKFALSETLKTVFLATRPFLFGFIFVFFVFTNFIYSQKSNKLTLAMYSYKPTHKDT